MVMFRHHIPRMEETCGLCPLGEMSNTQVRCSEQTLVM